MPLGRLLTAGRTILVVPVTWAGRAGLSRAWAGCWMGKACFIHTWPELGGEASLRLAYFETGLGLLDDLGPDASRRSRPGQLG